MAASSGRTRLLGPPPTAAERAKALADPGLSWREWFYFSFAKTWIGLGFLIADSILIAGWSEARNWAALVLTLVPALYAEFLAFRVLWTRPGVEEERTTDFRPSWYRPVRVGRWTPEAWHPELDRGLRPVGPDPNEFL